MGTNTLTQIGTTTPVNATGDLVDQYITALGGDFVPRNTSGAPTDEAGSLGSATYQWSGLYVTGNPSITGNPTITGNTTMTGTLSVSSTATFTSGMKAGSASDTLKHFSFDIGNWNMDTTTNVSVNSDNVFGNDIEHDKIKHIEAMIYNDTGSASYPLTGTLDNATSTDRPNGGIGSVTSSLVGSSPFEYYQLTVTLWRRTSLFFDSADFNDGAINRGIITVWYEA